jgi:hypothetical protein
MVVVMLERDENGRLRTSSPTERWEPAFGEISEDEARAYVMEELRYGVNEEGRAAWWGWRNVWHPDGRTPAEAWANAEYRAVWLAASGRRMMEMT